ncbi:Piso0_002670 [Millerozyma farinosa CBS 7064]|uniref:Piso0_002670 protein n=1 Tax=Pichia sorbitophila (strain ATCC MYA-4447 / BCRC 22081 / CBS 7064 / NBRC 10061 / NRRL Y-12695) TaxID=559304 RepID=G8YD78_PICSO|nr:Piso0_002670 [Millerozyma farinosa CBS 7064]
MDSIPAWKKLGLQVNSESSDNVLHTTTHLDGDKLTKKDLKKIKEVNEKNASAKSEKKPPKRVKKPKSERGAPPEKDQLNYLRQYTEDRANWKFSKQKQNWIVKNLENIEDKYEGDLLAYLEGMQGGSRDRVIESCQNTISRWNDLVEKIEAKLDQESDPSNNEESDDKADSDGSDTAKASTEPQETVNRDFVKRCITILKVLTEITPLVKGFESNEDSKPEKVSKPEEDIIPEEDEKFSSQEESKNTLIIDEVEVAGLSKKEQQAQKEAENSQNSSTVDHSEGNDLSDSGKTNDSKGSSEKKKKRKHSDRSKDESKSEKKKSKKSKKAKAKSEH